MFTYLSLHTANLLHCYMPAIAGCDCFILILHVLHIAISFCCSYTFAKRANAFIATISNMCRQNYHITTIANMFRLHKNGASFFGNARNSLPAPRRPRQQRPLPRAEPELKELKSTLWSFLLDLRPPNCAAGGWGLGRAQAIGGAGQRDKGRHGGAH